VTDAAGRFEILSLPRGRVLLRVRHPEHAVRDVEVDVPGSGETATLDPLQLQARVEVRGRVLRGARPLAGAIVFANQGQAVVEHAATGPDGTFVLRELGPGTHRIRARFSTLKVQTLEPPLVVVPGQPLPELEIRFEPGRVVRGSVVDAEGRPVPDALVMVADEALAAVRTGPDGQFAVEAPFDQTQLRVIRFEPMLVERRSVPKDATEPIEIRLPLGPRGGLQAKLLALPARAPVAGAIVRLEPMDPPGSADPTALERRRVAGRFVPATAGMLEVIELPAGRAMLALEAPGFAPHRVEVEIPPNARLDLGTILLEPGACFAGRVVDPLGRPIAGAAVHLGRELDFNLPGFAPTLRSDASGEFVVHGVGPQSRELYVRAPGHATGAHSIAIPEELLCDDPVPIVLPRGARLQVRVEDPGGREAGLVTVLLRRQAATLAVGFTADDGRVMFDHLRPGKYELHLPQHRDQPVLIELPPDAQQIDTVVEIEREGR
jgi:protocatechuate 3,4-dioxygenase beta subunit